METAQQMDVVTVGAHGVKSNLKAVFNLYGNFLDFMDNRLAQEDFAVFNRADNVVMGVIDAMMASLQCHAYSIFENLSVFKLSLSRYPAASHREIGCILNQFLLIIYKPAWLEII